MAASTVEICNVALLRLGVKATIKALTDQVEEAEVCSALFKPTRDKVLYDWEWGFATREKSLARYTGNPSSERLYAYALPTDFIRARYLSTGSIPRLSASRPSFKIVAAEGGQTRALSCDVDPASLVYTARIEDPTMWSPAFDDCFAWRLAAELAMPMSVKPELFQAMSKFYIGSLAVASAADLRERQDDPYPDSEFIQTRA